VRALQLSDGVSDRHREKLRGARRTVVSTLLPDLCSIWMHDIRLSLDLAGGTWRFDRAATGIHVSDR